MKTNCRHPSPDNSSGIHPFLRSSNGKDIHQGIVKHRLIENQSMTFLRITSYLSLGNSIFWAYLYTLCCAGVQDGSINGQGPICLMFPFFSGAPVNVLCLLAFMTWATHLTRKGMKKWSQILGREVGLTWGLIVPLNIYMFPFITAEWCINR